MAKKTRQQTTPPPIPARGTWEATMRNIRALRKDLQLHRVAIKGLVARVKALESRE